MIKKSLIFIVCLLLFIGSLSGCMEPKKINAEDICRYNDQYVTTTVTPIQHIRDEIHLEFLIPIFIRTGDTFFIMWIPIFDRYDVYRCSEGFYIGVDKGTSVTLGAEVCVCGMVRHDRDNPNLFCILVDTYNCK